MGVVVSGGAGQPPVVSCNFPGCGAPPLPASGAVCACAKRQWGTDVPVHFCPSCGNVTAVRRDGWRCGPCANRTVICDGFALKIEAWPEGLA